MCFFARRNHAVFAVPIVVAYFLYYIIRFHGTRNWTDFKGATLNGELSSALVLAGLSTVFNAMIVAYHFLTPSHPKFMMVPLRRICLMAHILSGTAEIIVSAWAIFGALITPDVELPLVALSIAQSVAGFVHCISAAYQTPIVFGARGFMTPGYAMLISLHAAVSVLNISYPGNVSLMLDQCECVHTSIHYTSTGLQPCTLPAAILLQTLSYVPSLGAASTLLFSYAITSHSITSTA